MKKLFFVALMCMMVLSMNAQYVDLGLPSGTKWKTSNEQGFYNYEEAAYYYGNNLPKDWQFQELLDYCEWVWTGKGYKIVGLNGTFIILPADGCFGGSIQRNGQWIIDSENMYCKGVQGYYQCYTPEWQSGEWASYLYFDVSSKMVDMNNSSPRRSIRLVQNP